MGMIDNERSYEKIENEIMKLESYGREDIINQVFQKDFGYRFCWSSNVLEGNTLSLDETIALIDYDETRGNHTFSEYMEAKNLFSAIEQFLNLNNCNLLSEDWLKKTNAAVIGKETIGYRKGQVYVGTLAEAVYFPPKPERVPELMNEFSQKMVFKTETVRNTIEEIAKQHIIFERIHPFQDGNGRTGRILLNQQLVNHGLLPVVIEKKSDYRQAFRRFDRNGDTSLMEHLICKGELESLARMQGLYEQRKIMQKDFGDLEKFIPKKKDKSMDDGLEL